ncbi:hypothetical protein WJX74_000065 [Apatococcus lobatus]|uniref:Uncharacterized protein n=1 Tax=Apatococcus lobatus TaxID=904363 RepID=A0AAW1QXL3_9CHLO
MTPTKVCASRLVGKVAIVTAATAGIGLGIALRLGQEGAKVVISSRRQANVEEALKKLRQEGIDCCGCVCHVGSGQHLQQLVKLTLDTYGGIDILISNAAANPASGPILETAVAAIDKILEINVRSPIILTKEVAKHLKCGSSIVYISSYTAFNPAPPIPMYAISKTALLGLTKALAEELGPRGIRVNCIAPGVVATKFAASLIESKEGQKMVEEATYIKRLGRPEDIAAAAAFLSSDDAAYITAETLLVAGGMQSRL